MEFEEKARIRMEHWLSHSEQHQEDYEKFADELEQVYPELVEKIRRESHFKTTFDLFELFISQTQSLPLDYQIGLACEMAAASKPSTHEMAILMLILAMTVHLL